MEPTETRESDLDHQFKVSAFDLLTDQYLLGKLSLDDVVEAYHEICDDMETQDGA